MKKVYYFLKWNFTNMESFTKRYIAYFAVGIIAATMFGEQSGAFFIAPLLMAIDFTVDIVRSRYQEFKQEQQDIIDVISGSKKAMSSDTITLDYTITPTISTVDSGYVTTSSITGLNSNIWTDDISAKSAITVDGTFEVQGRDVLAELDEMRDALMLIKRDVDMEAKYPKLKELKDEYAKQLAKYATFDAIKDSK